MISRRELLGMMVATAGGLLSRPYSAKANGEQMIERVGVQLYTVRNLLSADVAGTLQAVAGAGYVEVETAGYANLTADQFSKALHDAGLTAPSAHVPLEAIETTPEQLIEMAQTVGHSYLVVPWLSEQRRGSLDSYARVADVLNAFGAQCAQSGIQLAYHNHDFEFAVVDGRVPYDLLLERCDAELVKFELDFFWAAKAGVDTASYFRSFPGRFPLCHVKDMTDGGDMVDVGEGSIDFPGLFRAGETGGLRHYFVEHDNPVDALASITRSFKAVRVLSF